MRATLLALLCACTTVTSARRPATPEEAEQLTSMVGYRDVTITTESSQSAGTAIDVGVSSSTWTDRATQARETVPTAVLQQIELPRQHGTGALEGAALGAFSGAMLGMVLGFASGDDKCSPQQWCILQFSAGQKAGFAAIGLGSVGLIAGTIAGAIIGHRTTIQLQ